MKAAAGPAKFFQLPDGAPEEDLYALMRDGLGATLKGGQLKELTGAPIPRTARASEPRRSIVSLGGFDVLHITMNLEKVLNIPPWDNNEWKQMQTTAASTQTNAAKGPGLARVCARDYLWM